MFNFGTSSSASHSAKRGFVFGTAQPAAGATAAILIDRSARCIAATASADPAAAAAQPTFAFEAGQVANEKPSTFDFGGSASGTQNNAPSFDFSFGSGSGSGNASSGVSFTFGTSEPVSTVPGPMPTFDFESSQFG